MILVGIIYNSANLAMPTPCFKTYDHKMLTSTKDIHEAAKFVWNTIHNCGTCTCNQLIKAEFYDTETQKVWSVDSYGHTKKDYRKEKIEDFEGRYTNEANNLY